MLYRERIRALCHISAFLRPSKSRGGSCGAWHGFLGSLRALGTRGRRLGGSHWDGCAEGLKIRRSLCLGELQRLLLLVIGLGKGVAFCHVDEFRP